MKAKRIGKIERHYDDGSLMQFVELDVLGNWTVTERGVVVESLGQILALHFPFASTGPADGWPGVKLLHDAAEWMGGGIVTIDPHPKGEPGTIY